ncbi:MAG: hypothetical protein AB1798_07000, partial [Spirochaetota bacterium]
MPAQITHQIFADELLRRSLGKEESSTLNRYYPLLTLAAQGPDIFYHNQRTKPSGFSFGRLIHTNGFGLLIAAMLKYAIRKNAGLYSDLAVFILGFTSHAFLDRKTHPYIIYFSGWVEPGKAETESF